MTHRVGRAGLGEQNWRPVRWLKKAGQAGDKLTRRSEIRLTREMAGDTLIRGPKRRLIPSENPGFLGGSGGTGSGRNRVGINFSTDSSGQSGTSAVMPHAPPEQ